MEIQCIYCKQINELKGNSHFLCPKCNSYYHFITATEKYVEFNAYPEKNIKKHYQNRMIRVLKKTS